MPFFFRNKKYRFLETFFWHCIHRVKLQHRSPKMHFYWRNRNGVGNLNTSWFRWSWLANILARTKVTWVISQGFIRSQYAWHLVKMRLSFYIKPHCIRRIANRTKKNPLTDQKRKSSACHKTSFPRILKKT